MAASSPYPLSISIVTCDQAESLERCLASAAELAKEIVIVDSGSRDHSREVAEKYGAKWIEQEWLGYRDQKNFALDHCEEPWVLALDTDEELSAPLKESLRSFFDDDLVYIYSGAEFNRRVWFLGRWIYYGDWYPDQKLRLFRRDLARWGGSIEHDRIDLREGETRFLEGDLNHFSFPDMASFVSKINTFGQAYLERQLAAGKRFSLVDAVFRPWWRFFRCYILRKGFLDGFAGYWVAKSIAYMTFVRHSRLREYETREERPRD
ncbi:MAG: glycosyltransferase family 2 protein [Verrucomicrobiota bacterium]